MRVGELIRYSRRRLEGRRREVFLVCALPLGAEAMLRALEAAIYSLFLYFGDADPAALFTGAVPELAGAAAVFAFLRLTVCPPLWCAAAVRLREFTENSPYTSFSELLLSGRFVRRSISAALWGRVIAAAALVPAVISAYIAVNILSAGADSTEIFAASNAAAVMIASAALWVSVRLGLLAVPWVLAADPDKGGFSAVFAALRFTRGRRSMALKLGAVYFFAAATIVGIPFVIPEIAAAYCQGLSIHMKEDEYAGRCFTAKHREIRRKRIIHREV